MNATRKSPFARRDFRLLWIGEAVSALGDQFALVALPWLALVLTGSALALGTVLAVMAVPRALLMLVGGAFVDRVSPRRVMLASNLVRFVAVTLLGAVVLTGAAQLWMLYVFAIVFGIADAFFYPAQSAIVPELVDSDELQAANGITQGTTQLTVLLGPALAGLIIAALATSNSTADLTGIGVVMVVDGISFLVSIVTLLFIRARAAVATEQASVLGQIGEGIRFAFRGPTLRVVMVLSMGLNLLLVGPFEVGIPALAYSRLPEGAAAFGLILSAFGGGSFVGLLAATLLPPLPPARMGSVLLGLLATSGLAVASLVFATSTVVAVAIAGLIGVILGYTNISFLTWIQRRVPGQLMGRVMSMLMFSSVALVPIGIAVAGVVVQVSLDGLLLLSGLGVTALVLLGLLSPSVRRMGFEPTVDEIAVSADETAQTTQPLPA
jgi:MFS family permease